jgi:hypothetical protein
MECVICDYEVLKTHNRAQIAQFKNEVRQFGQQLPPNLEDMQDVFYAIISDPRFNHPVARSVARTVLSSNWDGIGEWRD